MRLLVTYMWLMLFCIVIVVGKIQWKVVRKVTDYGQDLVLFCEVENCCSEQAGWSNEYETIFIDVRLIHGTEKNKHDATVNRTGFTLIIRNLTKDDLNKTYFCSHGFTNSEPKFLREGDVFRLPGEIQWRVERKVTGYGQDLVLFCEVKNCCSNRAVWSVDNNSIFSDVRLINRTDNAKYGANVNDTGFSLIIKRLTKEDLNKTYICTHGFVDSKPKLLGDFNAFIHKDEDRKKSEKNDNETTLIIGVVGGVCVLGIIVFVVICLCKPHKCRGKNGGNKDERKGLLNKNTPQDNFCLGEQGLFQKTIEDWRNQDQIFIVTRATKYVHEFIKKNNIAIVTGSSGSGKSSIIHHIALELHAQGYEIIPFVTEPNDLIKHYKKEKNQVFVIDDIIGKVTLDMEQEIKWGRLASQINTIFEIDQTEMETCSDYTISKNTKQTVGTTFEHKLLISCRLHIFRDSRNNIRENYSKYHFDLTHLDMCLLEEEQKNMLKKYVDNITEKTINACLVEGKSFDFFPLLCKLCKGKSTNQILTHFSNPVPSIKQDIEQLRNSPKKMQFYVVALCVICDNQYEEKWINVVDAPIVLQHRLNKFFSQVCRIHQEIEDERNEIAENLNTLVGTYLKKIQNRYTFVHDKIYDLAAVVCGEYLFQHFIENASSRFIGDRYWLESINGMDIDVQSWNEFPLNENPDTETDKYSIIVKEDKEETYFSRLVSDLQNGDIYSFINNKQLSKEQYREKLLGYFRKHKETVVSLLRKIDMNENGYLESTPLCQAVTLDYNDIAEFLVTEVESNVNFTNRFEKSLLYIACLNQNQAIVELLLNKKADVSKCDCSGISPLHIACGNRNQALVELLLNEQANISISDRDGRTPLHYACEIGNWNVVELLINKKANVNKCDKFGISPLHVVCANRQRSILPSVFEKNADIPKGNSIVDEMQPQLAIVKLLLEKGADISLCDYEGRSLLHFACEGENPAIVELLLNKGADISKCDKDGNSAFQLARDKKNKAIEKLLLDKKENLTY